MRLDQFIQIMVDVEKKFKAAIADLPDHADFLSQSYLVVTRNSSEFPFTKKLSVADISERMLLLTASDFKDNLICLNKQLKDAQAAAKKVQGQEGTRIKEKINKIEEELNSFPLGELEFTDDFDVQVIFPSVSDVIQTLKAHPLTNKEKTCMCKVCIRVFFY